MSSIRSSRPDKPVIFAYHGYPWAHSPANVPSQTNHGNLHVRGYKEEGTTTTPFDIAVLNDIDRFHLGWGRDRTRVPRLQRVESAGLKQTPAQIN